MKSIKNIIKETVLKETNSTIKIDESHFFSIISDLKNRKKFYNFLVLVTTIIISIVIIINSLVFFVNDILLYPNNPTVNKEGAIIPERSCNRQSVLFLLNSAERWANTGIQIQEGDEIKISYSGGFHSDIAGLKKSAEDNSKPKYNWISLSKPDETNYDTLLLYNYKEKCRLKRFFNKKQNAYFGSVLYTIASEFGVQDNDREFFRQIEKGKSVKIKQNGTLFLSVNDIYSETNKDSCFNDNLGAILMSIDINRKINFLSWRTSWYRYTENTINSFWENSANHWFISFIYSVGFFIWAIMVLLFYRLPFVTFPVIFLFCIPYLKKYFLKFKNIVQ
jgi:hypothetical protein